MCFVGRIVEINKITKALQQCNNIIVTGKYGIGRTSLMRQVAKKMQDHWRFVFADFSKTSAGVCKDVLGELSQKRHKRSDEYIKYKSCRFMIANMNLKDKRQCVIVFDNIAKLTAHKSSLIRYLAFEKKFRFVALTEAFLPKRDLFHLRAQLAPTVIIELKHLSVQNTFELLQYYSRKHDFDWTDSHIRALALSSGGYPLGMKEVVAKEVEHLEKRRRTNY